MTWTHEERSLIRMANLSHQIGNTANARRMLEPLLPKALAEHERRQQAAAEPVAVLQADGSTIVFTRVHGGGP